MVNLENSLNYITHHIEPIIQWLFLSILLLSGILITRWLFSKPDADGKTNGSMDTNAGAALALADGSDIHTFLKKILDQTTKLEGMPLEGMSAAGAGAVDTQLQAIKKELAAREEEIGKLKSGGDQKPSADAQGLTTRIKELESKLAEYEILEDDIADLSLYKEENARLKSELEKAKSLGTTEATIPAPTIPAGEDIVAEFAEAVGQEVEGDAKPSVDIPATGDPMADFESAVKLEKKFTGEEAPAPKSAPAAASAPAEGDDLFAEFAAAPAAEEGSLDTDKMMAEMEALVNVESGAPSGGLDETSDIEKMAEEATRLGGS